MNSLSEIQKLCSAQHKEIVNQDIKIIQNAYDIIFSNSNFRKNIENLSLITKKNKYVNEIIKFINSDKKRPISLPSNIS